MRSEELYERRIGIDGTFAVAKTRPEKRQASTGIKPLTSAIKVHFPTISTKKSTGKAL